MKENQQAKKQVVLVNGYTELETQKSAALKDELISQVFSKRLKKAENIESAIDCIVKEFGKQNVIRLFTQMAINHSSSEDYGGEDDKLAMCLIMDLLINL